MGPIRGRIADGFAACAAGLLAASGPAAPAVAQVLPTSAPVHASSDLDCLTAALYYEARGEGVAGEEAVAEVVLNRLASPAYPKSVCAVVYQGAPLPGCQFTFACDGSRRRDRPLEPAAWRQAGTVAGQALAGLTGATVAGATHYHTLSVHPLWDAAMQPTLTLGRHQFFRLASAGYPGAFRRAVLRPGGAEAAGAAAPRAAAFAVWGLQVALVTPERGGLAVRAPPPPPAATDPAAGS